MLKKYFTCSWNIFQHSKRNFVSLHGHVISSIYVELCALAWVEISLPLCTIYMTELFLTVGSLVMGGSGVNGLKVVNLVILLNSKTMEVLTQHLLAFLRPSKGIWQRLEWRENKLFWLAGKCFGWRCNGIQIVGPDRWKRVSQPLNCEYFHSVINFIL